MAFLHKKKGDDTQLKFEFIVTIKSMEKLPSKYKHLRLNLSKGAKQAGTKEIFAEHQQAEPNAVDGTMKMICSMYKAAPGTTGVSNTGFEERAYKLSLVRINPRAMREREKKIGSSFINLADYASTESTNIGEDVKITMKVAEATEPTVIHLRIRSKWLPNYKGGDDSDGKSNISAMTLETASVGTIGSHVSSLNSIDEDEEEKEEVEKEEEEEESPPPKAKGKREKLTEPPLKPAASSKAKDGEGEEALKAKVEALEADLEWSQSTVEDMQAALDHKEKQLKEVQGKMDKQVKVQQELIDENEKAQALYEELKEQIEANKKSKGKGDNLKITQLEGEVERLKGEVRQLKEERDKLRSDIEEKEAARLEAEEELKAEKARAAKESKANKSKGAAKDDPGDKLAELETALEREKAKSTKYKSFVEKMKESNGALESEVALLKARGVVAAVKSVAESTSNGTRAGGEEVKQLESELERVSMQLVAASLGHAQAEQDRLEAKQQLYRTRDDNRKLKEKLTALEFELAQHKTTKA